MRGRGALILSRIFIFAERLWIAFLALFLWVAAFVTTAGLGLWAPLPLMLHLTLLGVFVVGSGVLVIRGRKNMPIFPTEEEACRALERQKGLMHRPLSLLRDRPATPLTPAQDVLWRKAVRHAKKQWIIWPRWPETALHPDDFWGVRYPLALSLLLFFVSTHAPVRLGEAALPLTKISGISGILGVNVWVEPPAYTQRPGFALSDGERADVLAGATMRTQVHVKHPLWRTPTLVTDTSVPLIAVDGGYMASKTLDVSTDINVMHGWTRLFSGHLDVMPDVPPTVAYKEQMSRTAEGLLDVTYTVEDDYGVDAAWLVADHASGQVSQSLVLPSKNNTSLDEHAYVDFTAEMIAGQPAEVYLQVRDVAGQTAQSEKLHVILPERPFYHPVAQRLVALRKYLVGQPDQHVNVRAQLDGIIAVPEDFNNDARAYLSLTLARQALFYQQQSGETLGETVVYVAGLLWDAALRIEKGPLSELVENVRQSQAALQKALAEGAKPDELKALFAKLQQDMAELFRNMTLENAQAGEQGADTPGLRDEDIARLMQKVSDMMASGAYDEARQALKQLEEMMTNLQFGEDPRAAEMMQALSQLAELAKREKQLIDESFENPVPGQLDLEQQLKQKQLKEETQALAQKLGQMGMPSPQMQRAVEAMQQALQNVNHPNGASYVNHLMNQAFSALEEARESAIQQLLQQAGYGSMTGMKRDPSGKLHMAGEDVAVPDEAPETLSRKIRDELFDRADDLGRGDKEQQYLKKLLERF